MTQVRPVVLTRIITGYYLATPVFAALDLLADAPVRAAGLGGPAWRWGYYVILLVLGLLCRARPAWAPAVGMTESAFNLVLLLLSILLPIWSLPDAVLAGGPTVVPAGPVELVNVALSGSVAILSFKRSERALYRGLRRRRP